ncbi:MAG: Spy/CpxP family protein refolding chaperone [Pseudomonadota bacterium]
MNTFTKTLFAATLAAATLSGVAIAGHDGPGRGEHREFDADRLPKHLEALGLSDAQKTQIKALRVASHAKHRQELADRKALHQSLRDLSPAAPNYTAEVDRIANLLGQEHVTLIKAKAALRAQEWAILTPSQQSQLAAMPKPDFKKMRGHDKK